MLLSQNFMMIWTVKYIGATLAEQINLLTTQATGRERQYNWCKSKITKPVTVATTITPKLDFEVLALSII